MSNEKKTEKVVAPVAEVPAPVAEVPAPTRSRKSGAAKRKENQLNRLKAAGKVTFVKTTQGIEFSCGICKAPGYRTGVVVKTADGKEMTVGETCAAHLGVTYWKQAGDFFPRSFFSHIWTIFLFFSQKSIWTIFLFFLFSLHPSPIYLIYHLS
jgi:hypothetical protein